MKLVGEARLLAIAGLGWVLVVLLALLAAYLFVDHGKSVVSSSDKIAALERENVRLAVEVKKIKLPDVPKGATPIAHAEGEVPFGPARAHGPAPGKRPGITSSPVTTGTATPEPGQQSPPELDCLASCPLTADDLGGGCRATLFDTDAGPGWRLLWTGRLRLWDGSEIVRKDVPVNWLSRPREGQREPVEPLVVATLARPRRWGWTVGAGGGYAFYPQRDASIGVFAVWGRRL